MVSGIFSFWQEFRVEGTLAALRELLPQQVEVLRDGKVARLHADQLVPDDVVVLEQGEKEELIHAENVLLAGTAMVSREAKAIVFATAMHTEFGRIAHLTQTARATLSPLQEQIAYLSRLIGILAIVIGLGFFAISRMIGIPLLGGFIFAIGIIVDSRSGSRSRFARGRRAADYPQMVSLDGCIRYLHSRLK